MNRVEATTTIAECYYYYYKTRKMFVKTNTVTTHG